MTRVLVRSRAARKLAGMFPQPGVGAVVAREILRDTSAEIAFRIRAELVCCQIYARVQDQKELSIGEAMESKDWHDLCYWGEAAARLAEGRCPGYETEPNVCRCPCTGCQSSCGAHEPTEWST